MAVTTETKVTWYGNTVSAKFRNASVKAINAMALQCEAMTKDRITANGQVDTGFMRNSVYAVTSDGKSGGVESTTLTNTAGQPVTRTSVPPPELTGDVVAICGVGASYAIFQEVKNPFLRPSFEAVVADHEATITGVFGEEFTD